MVTDVGITIEEVEINAEGDIVEKDEEDVVEEETTTSTSTTTSSTTTSSTTTSNEVKEKPAVGAGKDKPTGTSVSG